MVMFAPASSSLSTSVSMSLGSAMATGVVRSPSNNTAAQLPFAAPVVPPRMRTGGLFTAVAQCAASEPDTKASSHPLSYARIMVTTATVGCDELPELSVTRNVMARGLESGFADASW